MVTYSLNAFPKIKIVCPHCRIGSKYESSWLEDAIYEGSNITCVACGEMFKIELVCQIRDAELQRAADRSAIELLAVIRNAGEVEMDDFSEEFWQEVDAVLKTAGGD